MKIDPDAPAFPSQRDDVPGPGITVRAEFAKCFMAAMLPNWHTLGLPGDYSPMAKESVAQADALIAELNRDPQAAEAVKAADAITIELDRIIDESEVGIANERLAGNVVKEEFWNGQKSAAEQIKLWMEAQ